MENSPPPRLRLTRRRGGERSLMRRGGPLVRIDGRPQDLVEGHRSPPSAAPRLRVSLSVGPGDSRTDKTQPTARPPQGRDTDTMEARLLVVPRQFGLSSSRLRAGSPAPPSEIAGRANELGGAPERTR